MTRPTEIEGYVAGFRFDDDPKHYDAAGGRWKDLAGYGPAQDCIIVAGTPTFATVNGKLGVVLDNTMHAKFHSPIPWHGTIVGVVKPTYTSGGTVEAQLMLFGDAVTNSSNTRLRVQHSSTNRILRLATESGTLAAETSQANDNIRAFAFATDQETRKGYATADGSTVVESGPVSGTTNGNGVAIRSAKDGVRFGNTSGTAGSTTQVTSITATMFELHFFARNLFLADPERLEALVLALRETYGVT